LAKKPLHEAFLDLKALELEFVMGSPSPDPPFGTPTPSLTHRVMCL